MTQKREPNLESFFTYISKECTTLSQSVKQRTIAQQKQQVSETYHLQRCKGFKERLELIQEQKLCCSCHVVIIQRKRLWTLSSLQSSSCHTFTFLAHLPFHLTLHSFVTFATYFPQLLENSCFHAQILHTKWNIYSTFYVLEFIYIIQVERCLIFHSTEFYRSVARYIKWSCILWKKYTAIASSLTFFAWWINF